MYKKLPNHDKGPDNEQLLLLDLQIQQSILFCRPCIASDSDYK